MLPALRLAAIKPPQIYKFNQKTKYISPHILVLQSMFFLQNIAIFACYINYNTHIQ